MIVFRLIIIIAMTVLLCIGDEEIPPSIQRGEWANKLNGNVLWHLANWPQAAVSLPDSIWAGLPRRVVPIHISLDAANEMVRDGTWIPYVRSQSATVEDVILCVYGDKKGDLEFTEFEPTPTKEQEAWCKGLVERWLVPAPDGFVPVSSGGAYIATWNRWAWNNTSKIMVGHSSVPKKGSGGPIEVVYWFDRPMSGEEMLIEVASENEHLEFRRDLGGTVAIMRVSNPAERIQVSWPSGQFLVRINLPKERYRTLVTAYLERYPSSWNAQIEYNAQRLMLKVLDEAIQEMTKHIDGPLEFLRYSFRTYPFDDACRRAWNILPDNTLDRLHKEAILAIRNDWAKTPADQIKLSDYHDAMLAYRRELLAKIIAERDRIAKDGVEKKVP